ncbi:MAG: SdrD B-like domain-containing protein [candidate division KSB1 bacterium]|nr:SdrD B-like domain-containing protein [candidate division KSB1 bacterium]
MKTLILLLLCAGMLCPVHSQTLSGRVYEGATGTEPPTANPLNGVTVELWGSNNQGTLDQRVDVTTTNSEGWYGLEAEGSWEFYSIKEINPGGYSSNGATSVGGAVKTADLIEYMYPLSGKTLTGNKFWDAKDQPDNNPPVAEADGPYNGYTGVSMTLDGSGSWDPDVGDSITQYQWDLDGDGQYDDATGAKPQYTWNSLFSGTIYLRVYDSHNSSDADSASVNIREFQQDKAVIKGFKFNDLNQNGQRDLGEPGIPGWEIVLDEHPFSSPDQSTLTDSTGGYSFTVKPENDSTLCLLYEKSKNGWTVTSDSAYYVNVHAGQVVTGIDFGNYQRESSEFFDFGDVPTPYDPFAHYTVHQSFYLGSGIDSELAHQPDSDAQGDDKADSDDEDGIVLTSALLPGQHASLDATVYGTAEHEPRLEIWIDFDQNNVWDNYDKIVDDHVTTGTYTYPFLVPGTALTGKTYMRAIYSDWGPFPRMALRMEKLRTMPSKLEHPVPSQS